MQAGLVSRTRRETSVRLGNDAVLIACATIFGLGLGGLLHRGLVAAFGRWDRLSVLPSAAGAATREDLVTFGPWIVIGVSAGILALTRRGRSPAWSWRRALGVAIAVAGLVVLVVGELEVHVFDTLAQGWKPHDLFWDVLFHVPGETVALAGWLLLPTRSDEEREAP
ncbi:MAG: hypothetical protein ACRDJ1_06735 [Actinomycetota bacterium]